MCLHPLESHLIYYITLIHCHPPPPTGTKIPIKMFSFFCARRIIGWRTMVLKRNTQPSVFHLTIHLNNKLSAELTNIYIERDREGIRNHGRCVVGGGSNRVSPACIHHCQDKSSTHYPLNKHHPPTPTTGRVWRGTKKRRVNQLKCHSGSSVCGGWVEVVE